MVIPKTFQNSTILKGLEKHLNRTADINKQNIFYGILGNTIKNQEMMSDKQYHNTLYKNLDEKFGQVNEVELNEEDIFLGHEIHERLKELRSYDLGLIPDRKKLKKYRIIENNTIFGILKNG